MDFGKSIGTIHNISKENVLGNPKKKLKVNVNFNEADVRFVKKESVTVTNEDTFR
jgi:hypothetical protein